MQGIDNFINTSNEMISMIENHCVGKKCYTSSIIHHTYKPTSTMFCTLFWYYKSTLKVGNEHLKQKIKELIGENKTWLNLDNEKNKRIY